MQEPTLLRAIYEVRTTTFLLFQALYENNKANTFLHNIITFNMRI